MNKVLILGATSPIARALALRFASDGARLYLAARDADEARRVAEDVSVRAGVPALSGTFDASDFASHDEFIRHAATQLGGLDGVVVCFGTLGDEDVAQTDSGAALATIHQNFTGAVSLITLAARHLEQQRSGFIIVIGSVAGERGRKRNYVYGSAKGALALFAQGLRGRLAGQRRACDDGEARHGRYANDLGTRGRAAHDCADQSRRPDLRGVSKARRSRICAVVLALDHGRGPANSGEPLQTPQLLARSKPKMKVKLEVVAVVALAVLSIAGSPSAGVNPGDTITKDQADKVADLVSPGNLILVKQGMTMKIVPTERLEWPPPYKSATEKYSPQVSLAPDGTLKNYLAGLPFPLVDANDPQAALKVMWNFSYRPLYTDDAISKNVEIASYRPGSTPADPVEHFTIGNVGFYNNTGRTEVESDTDRSGGDEGGNPLSIRRVPVSRAVGDARIRIYPLSQYRSEDRGQQLDDESAHAAYDPRVGQRTFGCPRRYPDRARVQERAPPPTRAISIRIRFSASPRRSRTSTTSSSARSRCSRW